MLLLGRFTEGRMVVLERLRQKLRDLGFVPMVFNFDEPETKDFTETVRLLCNLSHFVIVDITNPRSAPLELQATAPHIPFCLNLPRKICHTKWGRFEQALLTPRHVDDPAPGGA